MRVYELTYLDYDYRGREHTVAENRAKGNEPSGGMPQAGKQENRKGKHHER